MKCIERASVQRAWTERWPFDVDRAIEDLPMLSQSQPVLVVYVFSHIRDFGEEAEDFAIGWLCAICRIFEEAYGQPLPMLSLDEIVDAMQNIDQALQRMDDDPTDENARDEALATTQPSVMALVVQSVTHAAEADDPINLSEDETFQILHTFKTVIDAIDNATEDSVLGPQFLN